MLLRPSASLVLSLALGTTVFWSGAVCRADVPPAVVAANALLADQLVEDARSAARNPNSTPDIATREALVLLEQARTLDPNNPEVLRLLVEAAAAAKDRTLEHDALKGLIRLDPGDLVSQVRFIEVIAQAQETVDGQLKVYETVFNKTSLDPQVRSEVAVRAARLLQQRGQMDDAANYLRQATQLNDANATAWRELAYMLRGTPQKTLDRLEAIRQSLASNPFQPDLFVEVAHIQAAGNQHDDAATYLTTALEQLGMNGQALSIDLYTQMIIELAAADRRVDMDANLSAILSNDKVTLPILLVAYTEHAHNGVAPGMADDPLLPRIRKVYDDAIAANPQDQATLADAIWFELFYAPTVADSVEKRLKTFEAAAGASNPVYERLRGWQLLRSGDLKAAQQLFGPLSASDPWATLGLVRMEVAAGDTATPAKQLQDLYTGHPVGLLAVHILNQSRKLGVTLPVTSYSAAIKGITDQISPTTLHAHRIPRDLVLITAKPSKLRYAFGEPAYLDVTYANSTDHALSVGSDEGVRTGIAVAATLSSFELQPFGVYAVDDHPRVFRLERESTMEQSIRLDQSLVRNIIQNNPDRVNTFAITFVTAPRGSLARLAMGVGGQRLNGGSFDVQGFLETVSDPVVLVQNLPAAPQREQMLDALGLYEFIRGGVASGTVPTMPSGAPYPTGHSPDDIRAILIRAVLDLLHSDTPAVQAWMVRHAPMATLPAEITTEIDKATLNSNPIVRLAAYLRACATWRNLTDLDDRNSVVEKLKALVKVEKDPAVQSFAQALEDEMRLPPPAPATSTQPTTQPTTQSAAPVPLDHP